MNEDVPSVTVLIAARPQQAEIKAVAASRSLEYPAGKLEIIIARGKQPSVQRNAGIKAARGELIYFLDDDSCAQPANQLEAGSNMGVAYSRLLKRRPWRKDRPLSTPRAARPRIMLSTSAGFGGCNASLVLEGA